METALTLALPTISTVSLVDTCRQYRLLEPAQLEEVTRNLQVRFPAPRALANELIQRGWLTPFQANQLLQGLGKDLVLGSYILLEQLGEGGMGQVFKARHRNLNRIAAVKLIRKEHLVNPDAIRRFKREVQAVAALSHPNIVLAYDADQIGDTHLLVMEYIEGAIDLQRLVKKNGPLPVQQACEAIRQAALGLQHAFERGLVHRDIKPANLLLTGDGNTVKVLDMGLARLDHARSDDHSAAMTQEGAVMGTPDYIAPEQAIESHTVDIRADLYALGCTFYYLLTGQVPFPGGNFIQKINKHQFQQAQPVEQLRAEVPPEVAAVVRKLMAKKPLDRYQRPAEVVAALAAVISPHRDMASEDTRMIAEGRTVIAAPSDQASEQTTVSPFGQLASSGIRDKPDSPPRKRQRTEELRFLLYAIGGFGILLAGLTVLWFLLKSPAGQSRPAKKEPHSRTDAQATATTGAKGKETWFEEVAALSAEKQVKAVAAKLKEVNPNFDGKVTPTIEDGTVTSLEFLTDHVPDITPVRALMGLKSLNCSGTLNKVGNGQLADLSPLMGMQKLTTLICMHTRVSDLSPLKEMKLTNLDCKNTKISNLSPLKGMKLTMLNCDGTQVSDLSPLKGMNLADFACGRTQVSDLSPLKGMKLTTLYCYRTQVSDLSPLKDMKLTALRCNHTPVVDLALLKEMPLQHLYCDFRPYRDTGFLRSIKTLEKINGKPAAEFWKEEAAKQAAFEAWCQQVAAMPAEKQVEAVVTKLKERNPGFDGTVTPRCAGGVVLGLEFLTDHVTDITPVRALKGLQSLNCSGSVSRQGKLFDLSPLQGMALTRLEFGQTAVVDLSPLQGMPLTVLNCSYTLATDLSPLKGMKLTTLYCFGPPVADLAPLQGMPLQHLECGGTKVTDLSPLKNMKLTFLHCANLGSVDLSPLQGMPLTHLQCDFHPSRDTRILRSIKTLAKINDKPAAEFWKEVDAKQAAFEAWCQQVAAMPAEKQVEAVVAKLKELNPGFDDQVTKTIDGGTVTSLEFLADHVTDLTPVRALKGLKELNCKGSEVGKGKLSDLSPLTGMQKLTTMNFCQTQVVDLSPLKGGPLTMLVCGSTPVVDLSPLKGMKLALLYLPHTRVRDLSPLKGMPLGAFTCEDTLVSDLSPLKGMKLTAMGCNQTSVVDLSPLKGMPLQHLHFDFRPYRDTGFLRSIKTLKKINGKPPAEFWEEVDGEQAAFEAWCKQVAAMPMQQQVEAVAAKLEERNPGFDGQVTPRSAGGVVVGLEFLTDRVTDLTPVRALKGLQSLSCNGSVSRQGKLFDLSPLQGMPLTRLDFEHTAVVDLSPLRGMPLTVLVCNYTSAADLSPLKDMKLTLLHFYGTSVADLAPLQGMPLQHLECGGTKVADLSPLKDMKLTFLNCDSRRVVDLSPLQGMPLTDLHCDFHLSRDTRVLRSIKTLAKINGKPVAEFWKDVAAQQAAFEGWLKQVAAMPAEKQVAAVTAKLKELNPDFDGEVTKMIEGDTVTSLEFLADHVSDISPVRALKGLKELNCYGSGVGKGKLADLSPLTDMKQLRMMIFNSTKVADLSPLKDLKLSLLYFGRTRVRDLSPLQGMPLTALTCHNTLVSDLSPLKGMKLTALGCSQTSVVDLSPLKGMPLIRLNFRDTRVADLSPLAGMPLKELSGDFKPERDARILRSLTMLEWLNDKPPDDFWKEVDEQKLPKKP